MGDKNTFQSGQILTDAERDMLTPEARKRYDLEQKIRGIMKKADDPRTPESERENAQQLLAKLITKYQIDVTLLEMLKDVDDAKGPVKIVRIDIAIPNKYGLGAVRARMLSRALAHPLGGRMVFSDSRWADVPVDANFFMPEPVADFARVLIASFLMQTETGMKVAGTRHHRELMADWRLTKNDVKRLMGDFRKGYLLAWGDTVGDRMRRGREEAMREVALERGGASKELALLDTDQLAQDAIKEAFGKTRTSRPVRVSQTGRSAGARDGRRADIGQKALSN